MGRGWAAQSARGPPPSRQAGTLGRGPPAPLPANITRQRRHSSDGPAGDRGRAGLPRGFHCCAAIFKLHFASPHLAPPPCHLPLGGHPFWILLQVHPGPPPLHCWCLSPQALAVIAAAAAVASADGAGLLSGGWLARLSCLAPLGFQASGNVFPSFGHEGRCATPAPLEEGENISVSD